MAKSSTSVIDLNGLSKPTSKLIDAISNAIGTVYAPTHIKRIAKANAESDLIKARAEIDKQELQKRAFERLAHSQTRRQKNIESISEKAFSELPEESDNTQPNEDWMSEFFNLCQDVSDDNLQTLWARLLAGEVSSRKIFFTCHAIVKNLGYERSNTFF